MPFGLGPRTCLGMKFALLEMKDILVSVILNFDITPCSSTPKELVFHDDFVVRKPKNEIKMLFKKRTL